MKPTALYRTSSLLAEMLGQRVSGSFAPTVLAAARDKMPHLKKVKVRHAPRRTHVTPLPQVAIDPRHCAECFRLAFPGDVFPPYRPQRPCRLHRVVTVARATVRLHIRREVLSVAS